MKFSIDKSVYSGALEKVKKALMRGNSDDSLKYILHEVTDKGLKLLATDTNIQIEYTIPIGDYLTVHEDGKCSPHGQVLADLVRGFPNGWIDVHLETSTDESTEDTTVTEKFHLAATKASQKKMAHWVPCGVKVKYPLNDFKCGAGKQTFSLDAEIFLTCLKRTQFATAKTIERPFLTNVCLDVYGDRIESVGSDGQRMGYYLKNGMSNPVEGRIMLYSPNIKELIPLLDDINNIEVTDDKKVLTIKQANIRFSCRQMDAVEYPAWRPKIEIPYTNKATVSREELLGAVRNIMNVTDFACTLSFSHDDQCLRVLVQPIMGRAIWGGSNEEVSCVVDSDVDISVVPRYLVDALSNGKSDNVVFYMSAPDKAFKVEMDEGYGNVITTMNLAQIAATAAATGEAVNE